MKWHKFTDQKPPIKADILCWYWSESGGDHYQTLMRWSGDMYDIGMEDEVLYYGEPEFRFTHWTLLNTPPEYRTYRNYN